MRQACQGFCLPQPTCGGPGVCPCRCAKRARDFACHYQYAGGRQSHKRFRWPVATCRRPGVCPCRSAKRTREFGGHNQIVGQPAAESCQCATRARAFGCHNQHVGGPGVCPCRCAKHARASGSHTARVSAVSRCCRRRNLKCRSNIVEVRDMFGLMCRACQNTRLPLVRVQVAGILLVPEKLWCQGNWLIWTAGNHSCKCAWQ